MRRQMATARCVVVGAALLIAAVACSEGEPTAPRIPDIAPGREIPVESRPSAKIREDAALAFTRTALTPGAKVLGSYERDEPSKLHAVVVEVEPGSVDKMLTASEFGRPLVTGRRVQAPPVPGYPPGTGERIASAQDTLTQSLVREVLVDRTDPDRVRVHVWAYFIE